jgi:hypothetical protein
VFHTVLLRSCHPPTFENQKQPSPPSTVDIEGVPQQEIEEVLDSRQDRKSSVFRKGYLQEENTWEPISKVKHAKKALETYFTNKPNPITVRISPLPQKNTRVLREVQVNGSLHDLPFTISNQGIYDPDLRSFRLLTTRSGVRKVNVSVVTIDLKEGVLSGSLTS